MGTTLPVLGPVTWPKVNQLLTIASLGLVVWFANDSYDVFKTSVHEGDAALKVEIEESSKRVITWHKESAEALHREINLLRKDVDKDRISSSKLADAVSELNTRTAILEDRSAREE